MSAFELEWFDGADFLRKICPKIFAKSEMRFHSEVSACLLHLLQTILKPWQRDKSKARQFY
jgi:hypothetical protein